MKRVRFAEEAEEIAVDAVDAKKDAVDADEGRPPRPPPPPAPDCPFGGTTWCEDVRSAEEERSSGAAAEKNRRQAAGPSCLPLEPFNLSSERAAGVVDSRGHVVPFDERRLLLTPCERRRLQRRERKKREDEGDAWIDDLVKRQREGQVAGGERDIDDDDVAGTIDGVPSRQRRQREQEMHGSPSSASSSCSDDDRSDSDSDDDGSADHSRPLAEAATLSGAELRALKLRLARLLRPEESVLQALRRLAAPPGIAGSPGSGSGGLLSSSTLSASEAAAATAAADAAAAALSSSPMMRESIDIAAAPPRPSNSSRGRTVPREKLPLFNEVTDLAAQLAAAGDAGVHFRPREALLRGLGAEVGVSSPGGVDAVSNAAFASAGATPLSGRKRRTEREEEVGEEEEEERGDDDAVATASAAAAAAVIAEINAPGLVINGVQTDYKLVRASPSSQQQQEKLYYSSLRGLYLDAASISTAEQQRQQQNSSSSPPLPPRPPTTAGSSPQQAPRVRCAATGAWKRARPVTDDGGASGSAL